MSVTVRTATQDDAQNVSRLESRYIDCAWSVEQILSEISRPSVVFVAAEDDGKLIGYVSGEIGADECELSNIAVDESYRRRGVGMALMNELFDRLKKKGVNSAFLLVREDNVPALALYGKCGFASVGKRRAYYGDKDAVIMRKNL